ncbi:MAG: YhbY family RNA-binding protein [Candidatus Accumulibacter sp.]|jgi:putative YhbY family RNA-binding protein|nr:YhbY family RNA-binding protein [Accumulibacter sp.]
MLEITAGQRRSLRSRAHALKPVVSISRNGLTEPVIKEIGVCLDSHELIKIRVYNDDKEERERLIAELCERLDAAPVQHIGKLLVVWRPAPDDAAPKARPLRRKAGPRPSKRSFQMGFR